MKLKCVALASDCLRTGLIIDVINDHGRAREECLDKDRLSNFSHSIDERHNKNHRETIINLSHFQYILFPCFRNHHTSCLTISLFGQLKVFVSDYMAIVVQINLF